MVLPQSQSSQRGILHGSKRFRRAPAKCLFGLILIASFSLSIWLINRQSSKASLLLVNDILHHIEDHDPSPKHLAPVSRMKEPEHITSEIDKDAPVMFSHLRTDRAGAALQDMLLAHAFCLSEGVHYGGACDDHGNATRIAYIQNFLESLGLSTMLPLACPTERLHMLLDSHNYLPLDSALWTPAWQRILQQHRALARPMEPEEPEQTQSAKTISVAVHIRRGDVDPCHYPSRYLPNLYYQMVLDRIAQQQQVEPNRPWNVTIYSERQSLEDWDDFRQRGYHLHLDGSVEKVWKEILKMQTQNSTPSIFVMSKSSFSMVPAVLMDAHNKLAHDRPGGTRIWYPPFWHKPLKGWTIVEKDIMDAAKKEVARLQQVHCARK